MSCGLRVLAGGLGNTLQDAGRWGYRHMGIPVSGYLDPLFARCAQALVGNEANAAALEMRILGPTLEVVDGPLRLALCGEVSARIRRAGSGEMPLPPWQTACLQAGDVLQIGAILRGVAYLAVAGGFNTPPQLGSRATYTPARIGGLDGRALVSGDWLPAAPCRDEGERIAPPWQHEEGAIRIILGPQDDAFSAEALAAFLAGLYTVTRDCDRMGMRLHGPALTHANATISDGVAPGAIQIAGDGQPIILLADCQTVGGYPKIATVISADLPRLAQCPPGSEIRFFAVDLEKAAKISVDRKSAWASWQQSIRPLRSEPWLDEAALYGGNLISGVVF